MAEIKRQGGLVYVPHPFDRMHAVPDYEHLLTILEDIDAIEVYNPRVAIGSFNEEAERFAAKYRIVAGAGSDSHVAAGPRLRPHPDARLRRARRSSSSPCAPRRSHEAGEPALRPGAEVPRDEGDALRRAAARGGTGGCGARRARRDAGAGAPPASRQSLGPPCPCLRPTTRSARSTWSGPSAS